MGPLVWEDEHCLVFHAPVAEDGTVFLGYLFIETRRHLPYSDWPGAPRGGTPAITELCKRLRTYF